VTDDRVLIVGAGPVGLITALGLAQAGVPVTVLEAEPAIVDSPRAMVYHWTVLEPLDRLGILAEAERRGFRKQDYAFRVFETGETIPYSIEPLADETPYAYNVHLGQHELAAIALERLEALPNAVVEFETPATGLTQDTGGVSVSAAAEDGPRELRGSWLIGADGARSTVRKALALSFEGITWPERFVATNVRYDFEGHGYARATFQVDPVHGAVIAKIDDSGLWRCTYSEDAALPEETVAERLPEHFAHLLPGSEDYELDRYTPYNMHQRAAPRFRAGRVMLIGDAAHATNPTGGLGLTSGLFDAFALSEALASVVLERTDDAVLDRWAEERRRMFLEIASPAASEYKRLVFSEPDPERRRADLEAIRRWTSDPDLLRERLRFTLKLRSRPLEVTP
jgi:3-(3-hydroxy-phenyl)propionate hydroxylase/6-hydroxy-3-succinoylpyridine 3-monooxygenase